MYIPRGNWINWWTGEKVVGGEEVWVDATMETIPIFVKEGACIPKYPVQQYVGEKKIEELQIDVYFSEEKTKSRIYADGGDGYDYQKGRFSLRTFEVVGRSENLVINQHKEGDFDAEYQKFKLVIHNLPFALKNIYIDDQRTECEINQFGNTYELVVDKNFSQLHITG
jgi:alpha-glucosidase